MVKNHAYGFDTYEDCRSVKVKAHKVRMIGTSFLFRKNSTVKQVLKAGNWSPQPST